MLGWLTSYVLGRTQRLLCQQGLSVFTYHRLGDPPAATRDPYLYVPAKRFDEHLVAWRKARMRPTTLNDAYARGTPRASDMIITFDDGFRSTLELGVPVMARHKVSAIQFLVAEALGANNSWDVRKGDVSEPLMDTAAVREWLAAGHQIGSHGLTHKNLRKLPPAEAREEITASRKRLEDTFGLKIEHFCYPYGSYNTRIKEMVAEAGYRTACTTEAGVNIGKNSWLELKRYIPLSSTEFLGKAAHRARAKILRQKSASG